MDSTVLIYFLSVSRKSTFTTVRNSDGRNKTRFHTWLRRVNLLSYIRRDAFHRGVSLVVVPTGRATDRATVVKVLPYNVIISTRER